jgi:hypothetical protein
MKNGKDYLLVALIFRFKCKHYNNKISLIFFEALQ